MIIYVTYNPDGDLLQFAEDLNCAVEPLIECDEEVRTRFNNGIFTDKVKGGVLVDISQTAEYLTQQLAKAKVQKLAENKQKRDARLAAGVEYEGVVFDSDTDSKLNISVQLLEMTDTGTVVWKGMNNERVLFTKQDFANLASLLKKLTFDIWGDGGLDDQYTKAISEAQVLNDLEMIEIDYNQV